MDVTLTEEQRAFQTTVRDYLEERGGTGPARSVMEGETELVDELWAELTELDLPGAYVDLEHGGLGLAAADLVPVLEEMGRALLPCPFPEAAVFSPHLLRLAGSRDVCDQQLPSVAAGETRIIPALYGPSGQPLPAGLPGSATRTNGTFELQTRRILVPFAGHADSFLVPIRTRAESGYGGISLFLVPAERATLHRTEVLDRTRPGYELKLTGVGVPEQNLIGELHRGGEALKQSLRMLTLAYCAWMVGGCSRLVDLSVDHATTRTQFGHPIGRFQAVKHRIVDMWVDTEQARSLVYYAAWALDERTPDAELAVSAAKAFCSDAYLWIARADIQNHGGTGFTWDHDGHLYLKQAKAWESYLGSPAQHRRRIQHAVREDPERIELANSS